MNTVFIILFLIAFYFIYKLRKQVTFLQKQFKDFKLDCKIKQAKQIQEERKSFVENNNFYGKQS